MTALSNSFRNRFQSVQRRRKLAELASSAAVLLIGLTAVITLIALADFRWEFDWTVRTAAFALGGAAVLIFVGRRIVRALRRCREATTASDVEQQHPEFGQRVRTTVQFVGYTGEDLRREGVEPQLVAALSEETEINVLPGEMEQVVPVRRTWGLLLGAAAAALLLLGSTVDRWEWSRAVRRAFLSRAPFTTLEVQPGDAAVEAGESLPVKFTVHGRPREDLRLQTRPAGVADAPWAEESLDPATAELGEYHDWRYGARISKLETPVEYRVLAGPETSPVYRVEVRYPLAIRGINVRVQPPAYTQLPPVDVGGGSFTGLRGSDAEVQVELDRPPASAEFQLSPVAATADGATPAQVSPATIDGTIVKFKLQLTQDMAWSLAATSHSGTALPENAYRIRVLNDQPPRVSFQAPDAELEVHTLAEILMRTQATDDYGLSRSGIVFQVNNGEEHTLLETDFTAVAAAADQLAQVGPLSPQTRSMLEKLLPLEHFALTEKDSVMYYAFAEDNRPEGPQRAESDWRFVDIRPFRTRFRAPPEENGNEANGGSGRRQPTPLEELIERERYTLNRTVQFSRRPEEWSDRELATIQRLIDFQAQTASLTRELADSLEEFQLVEEIDLLFQAETSMLGAVDTLSVGDFDAAILQEKDAHQYLVETRTRLLVQLSKNRQLAQALRNFIRRMRQKLRQQRDPALEVEIVQRLKRLATGQLRVSMQALAMANGSAGSGGSASNAEPSTPATGNGDKSPDADGSPESTMPTPESENMAPEDLEEFQLEAAAEAQELLDRVDELPMLTELARRRLTQAASQTEEAATSLTRRQMQSASEQTAETAEQFGELARQVEALLAKESAERVAASREIAAQLTGDARELSNQVSPSGSGNQPATTEPADAERLASRVREGAQTLEDVLRALAGETDRDAGEAPERVADLLEQQRVAETVQRAITAAQPVPSSGAQPVASERRAEIEDSAERFDVLSSQLDQLYRSLVMPRMARLRELERRLSQAQAELESQPDQRSVADVNSQLTDLARDLQQAEAAGASREELFQMADTGQLPTFGDWSPLPASGELSRSAPAALKQLVSQTAEELRQQIHELVLTDLRADPDSPIPPEYERLVEEYLKVLAADAAQF